MIKSIIRLGSLTLVLVLAFFAAVLPETRLVLSSSPDKYPASLTIRSDEDVMSFLTYSSTLLSAIDEAGIAIGDNDRLSLSEDTVLNPGESYDVTIQSLDQVSLTWSGYSLDTAGVFSSVGDLMARSGFSRLDQTGVLNNVESAEPIDDDGAFILSYVEIDKQIVRQAEEIPFSSVTIDDPTIYVGKSTVKVKGQVGVRDLIYEETYENSIFISSIQIGSEVVKEPVQEVIHKGTRPKLTYAPLNRKNLTSSVWSSYNKIKDYLNPQGGNTSYSSFTENSNSTITVDGHTFQYTALKKRTITMYDGLECCLQRGCHHPAINHNTFSGVPAMRGLVASFGIKVDGRYVGSTLPMGTILFVEGYGLGVVADVHGMSNNPDLIDVCFDPGDCRNGVATIGKVNRRVYILDLP